MRVKCEWPEGNWGHFQHLHWGGKGGPLGTAAESLCLDEIHPTLTHPLTAPHPRHTEGPLQAQVLHQPEVSQVFFKEDPHSSPALVSLVTPSTAGPWVLSSSSFPSLPAAGSAPCQQLSLSERDCPQGPPLLVTSTLGGGRGGWIQRERAESGRGSPTSRPAPPPVFLHKQCLLPPPPQDFQRPEQKRETQDPTPFCKKSVHKGAHLQSHCSFTAHLGAVLGMQRVIQQCSSFTYLHDSVPHLLQVCSAVTSMRPTLTTLF